MATLNTERLLELKYRLNRTYGVPDNSGKYPPLQRCELCGAIREILDDTLDALMDSEDCDSQLFEV